MNFDSSTEKQASLLISSEKRDDSAQNSKVAAQETKVISGSTQIQQDEVVHDKDLDSSKHKGKVSYQHESRFYD